MQKLIFLLLVSFVYCDQKYEGVSDYDPEKCLEIIANYLPRDPVIFEAGGHYGYDTVRFCNEWPESQIISFEPNPHAFEIFKKTTAGRLNIHGYNLAVNDYNGNATLYVCYGTTGDDPIFEGASSLLEASEYMKIHYRGPKVTVPCVVLDDWAGQNQVDHIDFMWLDLEGLELQILKSSPRILDTVKVIYTETNLQSFRVGTTLYQDLNAFLERKRFKLLSHWYTENLQGNAIFVKKEPFEN